MSTDICDSVTRLPINFIETGKTRLVVYVYSENVSKEIAKKNQNDHIILFAHCYMSEQYRIIEHV